MSLDLNHPDLVEIERLLSDSSPPLVFFVGAGLSKELGFPLWHELIDHLIEFGKQIQRLDDDEVALARTLIKQRRYIECGSLLKDELGARLEERLTQIFAVDPSKHLGIYRYLVTLPCAGFITTNYDTAIETAYTKVHGKPLTAILPNMPKALGSISTRDTFLIKLHGDVSKKDFILSREDYIRLQDDKRLMNFLYTVFFTYKIVFLGYGMSDRDILQPLTLLSHDYEGTSRRHVALLPMNSVNDQFRRELEDNSSINIVLYDSSKGHDDIERVILNWLTAHEDISNRGLLFDEPQSCTTLLKKHAPLASKYVKNVADRCLAWLVSLDTKWGLMPNSPLRAANIAEALIALHTANRVLTADIDIKACVQSLLSFHSPGEGWLSESLGVSTVHTTALGMYALSLYEDMGHEIVNVNQQAAGWLLQNMISSEGGWSTFGKSGEIRLIPTIWAYIALSKNDNLPVASWNVFRDRLLTTKSIGFTFTDQGKSQSACGWLLWLLSFLKQRSVWTDKDEQLLNKCLEQLVNQPGHFLGEQEGFIIDEGGPKTKQGVWVRWIHVTSAVTALGALPWLSVKEDAWSVLGNSVSSLLQQAKQGIDGHLKDMLIEQEGGTPFVFPTIYGMWALCEVIQNISGSLIDKLGLLPIKNKKVLLLRKRGTSQLIVPGGAREVGEGDIQALHREIEEELGTTSSHLRYWKTFEDAAAYEKGATVRITAYLGDLDHEPHPKAEIAELVWVGADFPGEQLSPIVRNKIVPELIKEGLID